MSCTAQVVKPELVVHDEKYVGGFACHRYHYLRVGAQYNAGLKSLKGLCWLHKSLMTRLSVSRFVPPQGLCVLVCNELFGLQVELYSFRPPSAFSAPQQQRFKPSEK